MTDGLEWSVDLGGGVRATLVQAGTFRTDVGAALGPVPRAVWERVVHEEIDPQNRIRQGLNCLLVECPAGRVLIETGIGERLAEEAARVRGVEGKPILPSLRAAGFEPGTVDVVVLSHLHFDHAGGLLAAGGGPAFPRARIAVQRREWDIALMDNPRISASCDQPDLRLAREFAADAMTEADAELMPSVSVFLTGGHTAGHQGVLVRGRRLTLAFLGDLAMRPWSISPRCTTGFDDYPVDSVAQKQLLFALAADEGWIVALSHERSTPFGRIELEQGRFRFAPIA